MLQSKHIVAIIIWVLIGTLFYLGNRKNNEPMPGHDFPKYDTTKFSYGWDFEKQEYRYLEPNPAWSQKKTSNHYIPEDDEPYIEVTLDDIYYLID